MDSEHLRQWVGRREQRADGITAAPLAVLSATLDRDDPAPLPDLHPFSVCGCPDGERRVALWAYDHEGWLTMQASAEIE